MVQIRQIRNHNKSVGQHFFDKGNPPILSKKGNYLVTKGMSGGFVVYEYDEKSGHINLVDNPSGEYTWQPYESKADAVRYASELASK
mgnify:FL=1